MATKLLTAAALALLSSLTHAATIGASSEEPSGLHQTPLRYVDANGKFVGRVLDAHAQSPLAVMRVGGSLAAIPLTAYQGGSTPDFFKAEFRFYELYYATPDCTGTAYRSLDEDAGIFVGIRLATAVHTPGDGVAVMLGASGVLEWTHLQSVRYPLSDCQSTDTTRDMFRLSPELIDITGQFQPPFSIR